MWIPACGIRVLWQQWTNTHRLQKSCGEKGLRHSLLSEKEGPDHRLDRLLLFF